MGSASPTAEPRHVESAPPPRSNSVFSRIGEPLFTVLVVGAGLALAALLLGTLFSDYDDEGYMLISIAEYLKHGHLYSYTYSQYGPFFFVAGELCFRLLRIPLNHDGGRLVMFVAWAWAALQGGWTVYRATGRIPLGAAACGSLFVLASVLAIEPMHPQWIVLVISVLAAHLSLSRRRGRSAFAFGAMGMALLLTKINIGVFFFSAVLLAALIAAPEGRWQNRARWSFLCMVAALPVLLMHSHLALYATLCLTATLAIFAMGLVAIRADLNLRVSILDARRCLAGAAFIAIPVVGWVMLRGTSAADLLNGLVLGPARQAGEFPLLWHSSAIRTFSTLLASIGSLLLCLRLTRRRLEGFHDTSGALCFAAGSIALVLSVARRPDAAIALLPFGMLPLVYNRLSGPAIFGRVFLMAWAAIGFLQVYPVEGSQVSIAAVPVLIWGAICAGDGLDGCARWLGRLRVSPAALARVAGVAAVLWAGYIAVARPGTAHPLLHTRIDAASQLPGAHWLHLPPVQEATYRFLAESVRQNCDILFTLPGMSSFTFWSSVPPPNGWNLTGWMTIFDSGHQQKILEILEAHPRSCVIQNSRLIGFWKFDESHVRALPLGRYILDQMPAVAERNGYVIRVHPRRSVPWKAVTSSY